MENKQATSCQPNSHAVPGPALQADLAAQARYYDRAVPGMGTVGAGPCCALAMLLRDVPVPAHSARARWPYIVKPTLSSCLIALSLGPGATLGEPSLSNVLFSYAL